MKTAAWVLQILLALMFAFTGSTKLMTSRADLVQDPMMGWANDFTESQIRLIGTAEVAGAVGLIVPAATGILPALTTVAAGGLAALMGGATATHIRRGEPFIVPLVLGMLALAIVVLRMRRGRLQPA
jgi:hypothetical protein